MTNYTVQADVMTREQRRRMSNIGITAQRYNLILKGNTNRLEIQSWASQHRMAKDIRFSVDPDKWYTLKLRVDMHNDQAIVRGKAWPRDVFEPNEWTLEATDPFPNREGSPGLYLYTLADCFYRQRFGHADQRGWRSVASQCFTAFANATNRYCHNFQTRESNGHIASII